MRCCNPYLLYSNLMEKSAYYPQIQVRRRVPGTTPLGTPRVRRSRPSAHVNEPTGVPRPASSPSSSPAPPPIPDKKFNIQNGNLSYGLFEPSGRFMMPLPTPFATSLGGENVYRVPLFTTDNFGLNHGVNMYANEEVANKLFDFYKSPEGIDWLRSKGVAETSLPEAVSRWRAPESEIAAANAAAARNNGNAVAGATPPPAKPKGMSLGQSLLWGGVSSALALGLYKLISKLGRSDPYSNATDYNDLDFLNNVDNIPQWYEDE